MTIAAREQSRHHGSPVKLYLFRGADPSVESMVRSIVLRPGNTEFGLGTTRVDIVRTETVGEGENATEAEVGIPLNRRTGSPLNDFQVAVNDMLATFPHLEHVTLQVAWFGTDLRAAECSVQPQVGFKGQNTVPYEWHVGGLSRSSARQTLHGIDGSPSDQSIYEAITHLKSRGLQVTLQPIIFMDVHGASSLPSPWGGAQSSHPWSGSITCHPAPGQSGSPDATADATTQINTFFGNHPAEGFSWNNTTKRVEYSGGGGFGYFRFILHMATIAAAAGADGFLIGSSLPGLTQVRGAGSVNPAVAKLKTLASRARSILGSSVTISYSAYWSEYHSQTIGNDVLFHMDPLWSDANIDYVGIANYLPLSDWRDGKSHLDWQGGFTSIHDINYLKSNIEGGELYDWRYTSSANRDSQSRTPISDSAYGKPWVFRLKDIRRWWQNQHFGRSGGVEASSPSAWVPSGKPIRFTELGCAAVDKGSNRPDYAGGWRNPGSLASIYYSNGTPDAAIQRAYIEAHLDYWRPGNGNNESGMVQWDRSSVAYWDARPYPTFPQQNYADSGYWAAGHWLTGRLSPGRGFASGSFGPYAFTNAETAISRAGITYQPWPIKNSDIHSAGDLDKSDITVSLAMQNALLSEFVAFPPSQVVNLTIFSGHTEDVATLTDYPAVWLGRVIAAEVEDNELRLRCSPVSSSIQRPGLRRNYQLGCPHVLFGPQCGAIKRAATIARTVGSRTSNTVTITAPITVNRTAYIGGTVEWVASGKREVRTITNVSSDGSVLTLRGGTRGLQSGHAISVILGCARTMAACLNIHNNIVNFGGQPFIPRENPLSQKNQYY